ncbi:hypothetical protein A4A49_61342 [Nicotiana attenuata]|uniref:Uncharacterized protein n=1 Tax=Nicotiana attenuata TaxID=49451 RepID=A0A1J6IMD5_NICAT|nr:hypothetical protein A4A49_05558 [Nicotiana attenuata]OIT06318.1 hypothetical protein A4A49_61342 [Nicotiana attenuata]
MKMGSLDSSSILVWREPTAPFSFFYLCFHSEKNPLPKCLLHSTKHLIKMEAFMFLDEVEYSSSSEKKKKITCVSIYFIIFKKLNKGIKLLALWLHLSLQLLC